MGTHDGHRNRMREKIEKNGIAAFGDHEVLEYILFHFVPMRNTNEIAHALIDTFGSFSAVLNADAERLAEVPGMTRNAAIFLSVLPDVFRRYAADTEKRGNRLGGRGAVRDYMMKQMFGLPAERLCAVALDARERLVRFECIEDGEGDTVAVSARKIVDFALRTKASYLVIAHNHPSGNIRPSQDDVDITRRLEFVLDSINVVLLDHYVFTDDKCFSFEEHELMN